MRSFVAMLTVGLVAATPAHAERFALSCTGPIAITIASAERSFPMRPTRGTVIYVIDTDAQTVHASAPDKPGSNEVCASEQVACTRTFTADHITLEGEATSTEGSPPMTYHRVVTFSLDRARNRLESAVTLARSDGIGVRSTRSLRCKPAELPATPA